MREIKKDTAATWEVAPDDTAAIAVRAPRVDGSLGVFVIRCAQDDVEAIGGGLAEELTPNLLDDTDDTPGCVALFSGVDAEVLVSAYLLVVPHVVVDVTGVDGLEILGDSRRIDDVSLLGALVLRGRVVEFNGTGYQEQ